MGQAIVEMNIGPASSQQGPLQILSINNAQVEEITTSGTSAQSTVTTQYANSTVTVHNNSSTLMWAEFGSNPTAAVETTFPVMPNSSFTFGEVPKGYKVALIDDS